MGARAPLGLSQSADAVTISRGSDVAPIVLDTLPSELANSHASAQLKVD